MAALTRHAKAPAVLGNRRNRRYCNQLPLGPAGVGNRPSIDEWLLPAGGGGDATVTPAAIAVTVATPAPAVSVGAAPAAVAATVAMPASTAGPVVAVRHLDASSVAGTEETFSSVSFTPDANSTLVAFITNGRGNHTTAYNYAITDSAGLTWTELFDSGDMNTPGGTNFLARGKVWKATVGGSPSSMTVTVDPFDGSTGASADAFGTFGVIECPAGYALSPAVYDANVAASAADESISDLLLDLGSAPTGQQIFVLTVFRNATGTHTFDSPPTDFSVLASDTTGYAPAAVLYSTANTDQTVTFGGTFGGSPRDNLGFFIQLTPSAGAATATPAAVAVTAAVPQPAVSVAATPPAVAATVAMPAPAARGGATRTPATIAAVATVPTPTPLTGTVRTPAVIAAVVAVGDPDVSVGTAPAAIAATSTIPTPTAGQTGGGDGTATPAAVTATSTVPQPAVSVGAAPAPVAATVTVPTPTAPTGAVATPTAVAAVTTLPAPAVAVGAAPAAVAAVATVPAPAVLTGTGSAPATITATATVPKPNVAVVAAPATIAATVTVPAPSIVVAFTVAPAAVLLAVTVPAPQVAVGAAPATVAVVVAIGTPTIPGSGTGLWSWYLRRTGAWLPASAKLDGVHPTTTDVT